MKSMTGWGRGVATGDGWELTVEVRSVNSRFREIVVHLPYPDVEREESIKNKVSKYITRGHVDVFVTITPLSTHALSIKIDKTLAAAYYREIAALRDELGLPLGVTATALLTLPGVLPVPDMTAGVHERRLAELPPVLWDEALDAAMTGLLAMRDREGAATYNDLLLRLDACTELTEQIAARAPELLAEFSRRLHKRVMMLLRDTSGELQADIEPFRLEQEMVILADRTDISEELARIRSHLAQLRQTMDEPGAVGRKLDFLLQEVFREFNTIASKTPDASVAQLVVQAKAELEKFREQVQNVE